VELEHDSKEPDWGACENFRGGVKGKAMLRNGKRKELHGRKKKKGTGGGGRERVERGVRAPRSWGAGQRKREDGFLILRWKEADEERSKRTSSGLVPARRRGKKKGGEEGPYVKREQRRCRPLPGRGGEKGKTLPSPEKGLPLIRLKGREDEDYRRRARRPRRRREEKERKRLFFPFFPKGKKGRMMTGEYLGRHEKTGLCRQALPKKEGKKKKGSTSILNFREKKKRQRPVTQGLKRGRKFLRPVQGEEGKEKELLYRFEKPRG